VETLGNRFDLLVIDEVHHFGAGGGDETLEMCTAAARLGLSATLPEGEMRRVRLDALVVRGVPCGVEELPAATWQRSS
jgi:superfamily II DNA or RNA helicase